MSTSERIQKILAKAGIASRRKAEELITEGSVTVNGKVAKLGDKAIFGKDAIKVNGKLIHQTEEKVYVAFHKPKGVICAFQDPESRTTLAHFLTSIKARLFPIGRMDFNSEGLLLLTNDGEFSEKLSRLDQLARVYQVKVKGHLTPERIKDLERGARMEKRFVKPLSVRISDETTKKSFVQLVMQGPQSWDLKTYFEMKGFLVERIIRSAVGHIVLKDMEPGEFRLLEEAQIQALLTQTDLAYQKIEKDTQTKSAKKLEDRRYERMKKESGAPKVKALPVGERGKYVAREPGERPARAPRGEGRGFGKPAFGSERAPRGEGRGFGKPAFGGSRNERSDGFGAERRPRAPRGESSFGDRPDRPTRAPRGEGRGFGKPAFGSERAPRGEGRGYGKPAFGGGERSGGFGAERRPRAPRGESSFGGEEREVRPRRAGQAPKRPGARLEERFRPRPRGEGSESRSEGRSTRPAAGRGRPAVKPRS